MKKTIAIDIKRKPVFQISNVAFKQVPFWFGQTVRNLEFSLIKPNDCKNLPLVIWVCGGSWRMIDKGALLTEWKYLAEAGYAVASVDYRQSNESEFPSQVEDVKAAIRYLRKHSEEYGIDKDRVAIMGASAGGHLSLFSAYSNTTKEFDLGDNLDESSDVKAVIDFYGPNNFDLTGVKESQQLDLIDLINLVGVKKFQEGNLEKVSPTSYIGAHCQPTLIFHGNADDTVPVNQSRRLYDKLKEHNIEVEYYEIEEAGHGTDHFYQDYICERVLEFLGKHL